MIQNVLRTYAVNLWLAGKLVSDLTAERMCEQPNGLINHPAWSLGHLVVSEHEACGLVGIASSVPDGWQKMFETGSVPSPTVAGNPLKSELLAQLKAAHERINAALPTITAQRLAQPHPVEFQRRFFPTVGDHLIYTITAHEMDHLGQLAAWRRTLGLPPAL